MPGKYDQDNPKGHKRKELLPRPKVLPKLLKPFLTDEEWYQTENYKRIREMAIKVNAYKKEPK